MPHNLSTVFAWLIDPPLASAVREQAINCETNRNVSVHVYIIPDRVVAGLELSGHDLPWPR